MDLGNLDMYGNFDKSDMLGLIMRLPEELRSAYDETVKIKIPKEVSKGRIHIKFKSPNNVVITGMGGSAIGGDILSGWLTDKSSIPIQINRNYTLPAFVDENSLVLAASYSGNTVETLSSFLEALKRNSMTAAITSNGRLFEYAKQLGLPIYSVPGGRPPRAALAHLFVPFAVILDKLGIETNIEEDINDCIITLHKMRDELKPEVTAQENPAKSLALAINGLIPVIYAHDTYLAAALRFKDQLSENSKYPAKYAVFPELAGNEIMCWNADEKIVKKFVVVAMQGGDEPEEIKVGMEIATEIIKDKGINSQKIYGRGACRLAKMFSLIYLGDFASYYLALLNDVDPTPIELVPKIKVGIASRTNTEEKISQDFQSLVS